MKQERAMLLLMKFNETEMTIIGRDLEKRPEDITEDELKMWATRIIIRRLVEFAVRLPNSEK